jgi:Zn-dependent protease
MLYDTGPLQRFLAVFDRTWPIGRLFGVAIRIHVLTLLVPLLALWTLRGTALPGWFQTAYVLGSFVVLYLVILFHEFGHIMAGRRFGMPSRLVTLSPLGGLAHLEASPTGPRAEIAVAAAGPATNGAWWLLAWAVDASFRPAGWTGLFLDSFADLNRVLLLFNLLPFLPLDGGRIFRGLLASAMHANRASLFAANVAVVGGAGLVIYGFMVTGMPGFIVAVIGFRCVQTGLVERMTAKFSSGPYARRREAWEFDDEAWKHGRDSDDRPRGSSRAGFFARLKAGAEARTERKKADRRTELTAEVDRLLEKVGEGGLASLTDDERATLRRASEELKKL